MGSGLLGGAEGGGAEHELERALVAAGTAGAAAHIRRTRERAGAHAVAGRFDRAFAELTVALALAEAANELSETCELELCGAYYAVQIGALESAHDLLDNAEAHALHAGDEGLLGRAYVVRGVASLAMGRTDEAIELTSEGTGLVTEARASDRCFALRQHARVLVRAGRPDSAVVPLESALRYALRRRRATQLADALDTCAALWPTGEEGARALGAADALRTLGGSVRWPDERGEASATLDSLRASIGYDRAAELRSAGGSDPWGVARATGRRLAG